MRLGRPAGTPQQIIRHRLSHVALRLAPHGEDDLQLIQ